MISRRNFIGKTGIATSGFLINPSHGFSFLQNEFESKRPPVAERKFVSEAVEETIKRIKSQIANPELAWLFENCFPNTLDTTVNFDAKAAAKNHPDTYVITSDIDVIRLRDSSAQIHPYLPLMKHDIKLRQLVEGILLRQFICIQRDPYANAYYKDLNRVSEWKDIDQTEMRDGIHERKWELDSLCYVLRLMHSYWKEVNYDLTFFRQHEQEFKKTIRIILQTLKDQRRYNGTGNEHEILILFFISLFIYFAKKRERMLINAKTFFFLSSNKLKFPPS